MLGRTSELFVISSIVLLGFALIAGYSSHGGSGVSIHFGRTSYVLPPSVICVGFATLMCFFATTYSLYWLPFSRVAALWHFGLTNAALAVFWFSFYRVSEDMQHTRTAVWTASAAELVILLAQTIFLWNLIQALMKWPKMRG